MFNIVGTTHMVPFWNIRVKSGDNYVVGLLFVGRSGGSTLAFSSAQKVPGSNPRCTQVSVFTEVTAIRCCSFTHVLHNLLQCVGRLSLPPSKGR